MKTEQLVDNAVVVAGLINLAEQVFKGIDNSLVANNVSENGTSSLTDIIAAKVNSNLSSRFAVKGDAQ